MKKYLTFSNFMVVLGIMTILFYLIPAVRITATTTNTYGDMNLFTATFGGPFSISLNDNVTNNFNLTANGGLIVGFFLGIIGIVLTALRNKIKIANLFAFPFYVAAGVLVACTVDLTRFVNFQNPIPSTGYVYSSLGGSITVCVFWFILAFFAICNFIAAIAKPKQQTSAY